MSYIKQELVTTQKLVCTHDKVKYIWDYGCMSMNPGSGMAQYAIAIILKNEKEERVYFKGEIPKEVIGKAEEFLATL